MIKKGKGTSQELTGSEQNVLSEFFKKKTLGVPRWGWLTALACVGLFHISK
jgi:hypothetical protein